MPLAAALRDHLDEWKLTSERTEGLVFGDGPSPFVASGIWRRAHAAWKKARLEPIGLHEARHSFASLMIAAGVNAKALSTYMGHSSITITLDRYGHLMPGNKTEAAALLDAYLAQQPQTSNREEVDRPMICVIYERDAPPPDEHARHG